MAIEKIFNEGVDRREAVNEIRELIRKSIDEACTKSMKEKYAKSKKMVEKDMEGKDPCWDDHEMVGHKMKDGKKVPDCVPVKEGDDEKEMKDSEGKDSDDDGDDDEEGDDDEDDSLEEAMQVVAMMVGRGGKEEMTINRMDELKQAAKTRKYDYFTVMNARGQATKEYSVDPMGNLVEM